MKDTNNVCAQCCKSALITEDNCYFSQIKRRETPYLFVYFLGCDYFNRSGSITPSMIAKKKICFNERGVWRLCFNLRYSSGICFRT